MADINRRPLKTRSNPLAVKAARYLATRQISPNQISLLSVAFAAIALLGGVFWNVFNPIGVKIFFLVLILVGVQGRLLCNLLDGMVAIEGGKKTPAGELYNDIPDRVSDFFIFTGLGLGLAWPFAFELGLLVAIVAIMTAYIRVLGVSMGTPAYFSGPMAKQHRMATVTAGTVLTIVGLFFFPTYASLVFYLLLLLLLLGSVYTCVDRIRKIKAFMEQQAAAETTKMQQNAEVKEDEAIEVIPEAASAETAEEIQS